MSTRQQTLIIAEAGVNHNGDLRLAIDLVDAAAEAGADVVKFQTFRANQLATEHASQASYQKLATGTSESQLEMLKRLELKPEHHDKLISHCNKRNIEFLSTAFDSLTIDFLASLNLKRWKIPSGEITNLPYLRQIGGQCRNIILSTGMSNLSEIEAALTVLEQSGTPRSQITVLHCTSEYPAPPHEVNLRAIQTIACAFGVSVGYSDHTNGIAVPVAAVAMGASVIEKHLTLDRTMSGPDHKSSLEPDEFGSMVNCIRTVELALGNGVKEPSPSESKNMIVGRKSIVAARPIRKGQIITSAMLTTKRPATGLSPMLFDLVVGKVATRDYEINQILDLMP